MAEAAKVEKNPPNQPKRPPPAHTEETSSSLQLKDQPSPQNASLQTREPSSSLPKDPNAQATPQDPSTLMNTISQINDPEVQEMIDVVQKFVQISKQNKPRGQRALELLALLRIRF
ncbi:hypothetical protein TNCV_4746751 [Trichonephila clavipes]|nr:hypothetical protein TNCV_4746751 [Trichonephila clavipes]